MRKLEIYAKYPIAYIQFFAQCKRTRSAVIHQQFGNGSSRILFALRIETFVILLKEVDFNCWTCLHEAGIWDVLVVQVKGGKEVTLRHSI